MVRLLHILRAMFWGQRLKAVGMSAPRRLQNTSPASFAFLLFAAFHRKQVDSATAQGEQLFSAFMDNLPGFAWMKDIEGRYVYVNQRLKRLIPYPNRWLGKTDADLWPKEIANTFRENDKKVITSKQVLETIEPYRLAGEERYVLVTKFPIFNSHGEVVMVGGAGIDITEQRKAERDLRASEERYRELFESARDAVYVHDLTGVYISVNRAAEILSGYSRDQIIGRHFSKFLAAEQRRAVIQHLEQRLRQPGGTSYEVEVIARDGRRIPVEVSSSLIYEDGEPVGVMGLVRDLTERKRAGAALRNYSRQLIEAQEAERERIARELHDQIGQILTAVKINLESIQRLCQVPACLPLIEEGILIIDQAFARVSELSLELRPSMLDDLGLTAAVRWYVERYAQRTGVVAEVMGDLEKGNRLPRELETACFRIVQEALTNVARHSRAKRVSVRLEESQQTLLLRIKDDGVGFNMDSSRSHAGSNATLGLLGMEERVQAVGGVIQINSQPSQGTEIVARFPLAGHPKTSSHSFG